MDDLDRAVVRGLGWLCRKAIGPGLLVVAVLLYRWHTGEPFRPWWTGRRRLARHVRATLQCLVTVVVLVLLWQPVVTGIVVGVITLALATAIVVTRYRARQLAKPRRVTATVGRYEPVAALTATGSPSPGSSWSTERRQAHQRR